jgi:uncharacterized membrane protein
MKVNAFYSLHFSIIILVGLVFVGGGAFIAFLLNPGSSPNSMTKLDHIYLGAIIAAIGGGVIPIVVADWHSNNQARSRRRHL